MIDELLDGGASVDLADANAWDILHLAAYYGKAGMIKDYASADISLI